MFANGVSTSISAIRTQLGAAARVMVLKVMRGSDRRSPTRMWLVVAATTTMQKTVEAHREKLPMNHGSNKTHNFPKVSGI